MIALFPNTLQRKRYLFVTVSKRNISHMSVNVRATAQWPIKTEAVRVHTLELIGKHSLFDGQVKNSHCFCGCRLAENTLNNALIATVPAGSQRAWSVNVVWTEVSLSGVSVAVSAHAPGSVSASRQV